MNCKHSDVIRIVNNTKKEYYCKLKDKEITEWECRECMMRLPNLNQDFKELFKGFGINI